MLNWIKSLVGGSEERKKAKLYVDALEAVPSIVKYEPCADRLGICWMVAKYLERERNMSMTNAHNVAIEVINGPALKWEHHSGFEAYPVPNPDNKQDGLGSGFHSGLVDNWDKSTEYGRLRWDLHAFLLNYWKKKVKVF